MAPTIHLNGTSKKDLVAEYEHAMVALDRAQEALQQITVHGRDYYVQSPNAINGAISESKYRIDRVRDVRKEIEEIFSKILDQEGAL